MSYLMKVVIVGDDNSGKETIFEKYLGQGKQIKTKFTIGADFVLKQIYVNGQGVKLQLWDLLDGWKDKIPPVNYYHGAIGGIIVFDVTKRETFANLEEWRKEIWENNGKGVVPLLIFGLNAENRDQFPNSVTIEEGMKMASTISKKAMIEGYEIPYYEISVETGENIETGFEFLAKAYISYIDTLKTKID